MLVLSRKPGEKIVIGDDITVVVLDLRGEQVQLGIAAPRSIPVHRYEVYESIRAVTEEAASINPEESLDALRELGRKPRPEDDEESEDTD